MLRPMTKLRNRNKMIVLAMIVDIVQYMPEIVDPMIVVRTTSISKIVMSMRKETFSLAPMGVLAPRSAHARPSAQPPINASGNFSAHMSEGGRGANFLKTFSDQFSR